MRVGESNDQNKIQRQEDGTFVWKGQVYGNLGELFMAISFEHVDDIEKQIFEKADAMKKRNVLLQGLREMLVWLNSKKDDEYIDVYEKSSIPKPGGDYYTYKELWDMAGLPELGHRCYIIDDNGNLKTEWIWNKYEIKEALAFLQPKIDSLNSESQTDMIEMQSLMDRRDNVYQSISNLLRTNQQAVESVAANLR